MTELFIVIENNTDKLVAIFLNEEDFNAYMEDNKLFSDLVGRRVVIDD